MCVCVTCVVGTAARVEAATLKRTVGEGARCRLPGPVVITRAHLRHRGQLRRHHHKAREGHAVLDVDAQLLRRGGHLREPHLSERGGLARGIEALSLIVQPVLLIHGHAPLRGVEKEVIPKSLLKGYRHLGARLHDKGVVAAVLGGVHIVGGPVAIVRVKGHPHLLVKRLQPAWKRLGRGRPILHAAALSLFVPPAIKLEVLYRHAAGGLVRQHVEQRGLVVKGLSRVGVRLGFVVLHGPTGEGGGRRECGRRGGREGA